MSTIIPQQSNESVKGQTKIIFIIHSLLYNDSTQFIDDHIRSNRNDGFEKREKNRYPNFGTNYIINNNIRRKNLNDHDDNDDGGTTNKNQISPYFGDTFCFE